MKKETNYLVRRDNRVNENLIALFSTYIIRGSDIRKNDTPRLCLDVYVLYNNKRNEELQMYQ